VNALVGRRASSISMFAPTRSPSSRGFERETSRHPTPRALRISSRVIGLFMNDIAQRG
jgi:hypothetical protein